jgi:predicted nucleic-acid-binding Zn-ribbon protein
MSKKGPCEYEIDGEAFECTHCKNTKFIQGSAMLNTAGMTLLGLDWANRTAETLMCNHCGLIHWFGKPLITRKT